MHQLHDDLLLKGSAMAAWFLGNEGYGESASRGRGKTLGNPVVFSGVNVLLNIRDCRFLRSQTGRIFSSYCIYYVKYVKISLLRHPNAW